MLDLLSDPAVWASFGTLVVLEIVLGVDNVIFISIIAQRLPKHQQAQARFIGLGLALVLRLVLLASIAWIIGLTRPVFALWGFEASWRDIILFAGGLFLLAKASNEIYNDVEGAGHGHSGGPVSSMGAAILQIVVLDLVFSLDSVITAVGIADHIEVMVAAVVIAVIVMAVSAGPISAFVERHPSTRMLALAFLLMIGMALMADGLHAHIDRGFIYAAMVFAGGVEGLNLLRARRRAAKAQAKG